MVMTRGAMGTGILRPEDVDALLVQPVREASVALRICRVVMTDSADFRVPILESDAGAGWYPEATDIDPDDATVGEVVVRPSAVKGLTKVSNQLAADTTPDASAVVGESIARRIAREIDLAFFGSTVENGPDGLLSLSGVQLVDAGSAWANLDPFSEAMSKMETVGAQATAFAANAATVLALTQLKDEANSNRPLLGVDPTRPTQRTIHGVPLHSVPKGPDGEAVEDGIVWAIDKSRTFAVMRSDVDLQVDPSFYFGSDSLAVRCVARVGFAYPHEAAIVKIGVGGS